MKNIFLLALILLAHSLLGQDYSQKRENPFSYRFKENLNEAGEYYIYKDKILVDSVYVTKDSIPLDGLTKKEFSELYYGGNRVNPGEDVVKSESSNILKAKTYSSRDSIVVKKSRVEIFSELKLEGECYRWEWLVSLFLLAMTMLVLIRDFLKGKITSLEEFFKVASLCVLALHVLWVVIHLLKNISDWQGIVLIILLGAINWIIFYSLSKLFKKKVEEN